MLRVLAFAYPYTWDSLPLFYRVRVLLPVSSACWAPRGSQLFPELPGVRAHAGQHRTPTSGDPGVSLLALTT